jgi:predicted nucleic acid-binding protein
MERYTLDAVGLLRYAVGRLPEAVVELFKRAGAGDCVIEIPAIAVVEAIYKFDKRDSVAGVELTRPATDVPDLVAHEMPVTVVEHGIEDIRVLAGIIDEYTIHDAMIVASHRVGETEAIITTDENISHRVPTVW